MCLTSDHDSTSGVQMLDSKWDPVCVRMTTATSEGRRLTHRGVCTMSLYKYTLTLFATNVAAVSSAQCLELWRWSCPITMPRVVASWTFARTYAHKPFEIQHNDKNLLTCKDCDQTWEAWMMIRSFIRAQPASILPRRPAVPNSILGLQERTIILVVMKRE